MIRFAQLFHDLDQTTKTSEKTAAMVAYLAIASAEDAAWAIYFLSGQKLRQLVPTKLLRMWAAEVAEIPAWLFDESYHAVGDLAEALTLAVPPGFDTQDQSLSAWVEQRLIPLRSMNESQQCAAVFEIWRQTTSMTRFVVMKLITGSFRVGVSKRLVTRAIANHSGVSIDVIAHRLMGDWRATAQSYLRLIDPNVGESIVSQPYPFCLAHPIDINADPKLLGDANDYFAEWKWDGIRGQVIRRGGRTFIWSRGEELMENRWPEIESAAELLPDGTVLDGEILASLPNGEVLLFADLQRRIGRKITGKKLLAEVPVVFYAFDVLELGGRDVRTMPLIERREWLDSLMAKIDHPHLRATELLCNTTDDQHQWEQWKSIREQSRQRNAEGLMLKRKDGLYDVGRVTGTWWKWKVSPYTIDAVMIYAQKGHGKRASLFTDYTFAVWQDGVLVPFAKAYSGLTDAEIRDVDRFVRQHTNETFGPVRSVTPSLVMELAFEGLQRSRRHKSGIATRFPRIVRWRHDKKASDANSLDDLLRLLPNEA